MLPPGGDSQVGEGGTLLEEAAFSWPKGPCALWRGQPWPGALTPSGLWNH